MSDSVDSLQEKCRTLEAECHSLLQRSIQSEQKHSDAAGERDRLKSATGDLTNEKQQLGNKVRALQAENEELASQLAAQAEAAGGDLDIVATLEKEKASARRANELRMELEGNFAELSVQFETLQGEHEALKIDNNQKTKDLEASLTHIEALERNVEALEKAAAQAIEEKEHIAEVLTGVAKDLAKEKKVHDKCKEDLRRSQNSLQDLRDEMEKHLAASDKLRRDYDALKKKSVVWKKQAEHARDLEMRNEQLVAQYAFGQKELADARREIGRLQAQLLSVEEEERKRAASSISPKTLQFLRDQLAEANERLKTLRFKERTWGDQRSALEAQVKRLRFELQRKNPSQLRLMEMEVQNELLLGMVQTSHSPPRQRKVSSIPKPSAPPLRKGAAPPRKLPPISEPASPSASVAKGDTPMSGSAVSATRKARSKAATPPPSSNASEAGGDRTAADQVPTPRRPHSAGATAASAATAASSSPPPVAAEEPADVDGVTASSSDASVAASTSASARSSVAEGEGTRSPSASGKASARDAAAASGTDASGAAMTGDDSTGAAGDAADSDAAEDENYSDDAEEEEQQEEEAAAVTDTDSDGTVSDADAEAACDK